MLTKWLNRTNRPNQEYKFKVIDVSEQLAINEDVREYLGAVTLEQYRSIKFLKRQYGNTDKKTLSDYLLNNAFPNTTRFTTVKQNQPAKNVRQGDFGEILTTIIIENFTDLRVPISKLRYKFNNDRSVFCTDLISHNQGNTIVDLIYYEIKTKVTQDEEIAKKAYDGLLKDEQKPTEGIADFLSRHYHELAEEVDQGGGDATNLYDMADKFSDIVKNPSNYSRSFEIVLIIEKNIFQKIILENLNNISLELSPLEVTVILIDNLLDLVDDSYKRAIKFAENYVFNSESLNNEIVSPVQL